MQRNLPQGFFFPNDEFDMNGDPIPAPLPEIVEKESDEFKTLGLEMGWVRCDSGRDDRPGIRQYGSADLFDGEGNPVTGALRSIMDEEIERETDPDEGLYFDV